MATTPSRNVCRAFVAFLTFALLRPAGAALPPNFVDELVATVPLPTALAFTPDRRLLIASQTGALYVYQNGALLPTPALTFPPDLLCTNSERGLVGVAVDPDFEKTQYIFLFYTLRLGAPVCEGSAVPKNRVSRFVLTPANQVSLASETVLLDNLPSPNGNRNGGDLQFGRDGYLYVGVGDGGLPAAARQEHVVSGKVLRITRGGGIPATNPFQGLDTARCNLTGGTTPGNRCQETFAWGFRNPWRLAFDPNAAGTSFRINDVGQIQREEINQGEPGVDYGWNCREGTAVNSTTGACNPAPPAMRDPIYEYARNSPVPGTTAANCHAITAGAFVPNGLWPGYDGTYLFADYICGWMFTLSKEDPGEAFAASDFAPNIGRVVTLAFGPFEGRTRALYYTAYDNAVRRIRFHVNTNNVPVAVASASPVGGPLPTLITFDATGSSDADPVRDMTLAYFWDFGDGTLPVATNSLTIQHTYPAAGTYTVTLRVRDEDYAFSPPVTLTVQPGNNPPVPAILSPAPDATFRVGQLVNLTGGALDAEDGPLPPSRLRWSVFLRRGAQSQLLFGPVIGNPVAFTAPAPADLASAATSFLEIRLVATDMRNLSSRVVQNFQPLRVPVAFGTQPQGLVIPINGVQVTAPAIVASWSGYVLNVDAPDQMLGGNRYSWVAWSDSGSRAHAITTGDTLSSHVATFQQLPQLVTRYFTLAPCRLVDTRGTGPRGGPPLAAGAVRNFDLDGVCGVPATAKALAVNVTVTQSTAAGDVRMWAQGGLQPTTSVISYRPGRARANNGIVSLGPTGGLSVFAGMPPSGTVHFILDVAGYFE
jgi:glucose/arabinose dehydrogenase